MKAVPTLASALLLLATALPFAQGAGETQPCASTFDTTVPFTDYCYHQGVWYAPDTAQYDVIILPPEGPYAVRDIQLVEESVDMLDAGLHALGGSALSGLSIDRYTVGMDFIPPAAAFDPEVTVVLTTETQPFVLLGLAIQFGSLCHGISPATSWGEVPGFHQHEGSPFGSVVLACNGGGKQCFVINTSFAFQTAIPPDANERQWMFDLISHEVGHCLTLGHVGDANTESTDDSLAYPHHDIMSYENDGLRASTMHCVSNLNALVAAKAWSSILNPPGTTATAPNPAAYVHMKPADYSQPACAQSDATIFDYPYFLTIDPLP